VSTVYARAFGRGEPFVYIRTEEAVLHEAVRLRNRAAHGFQVSVTCQNLAGLAGVARELLGELASKVA
jgi:hypothetical protein